MARWYLPSDMPAVAIDEHAQEQLLEELSRYRTECAALPSFADIQRSGYGPGYGEVEAHLLYCMVRHFKPKKIIEIGSGTSTFFALRGLDANRREDNFVATMTCIEPYPMAALKSLADGNRTRLIVAEVQDVHPSVFSELSEGDILFIDSSHVSKTDSDVNYVYLELLPRLANGVIVHIHDISFPFLTFPPEHPLFVHSILLEWVGHGARLLDLQLCLRDFDVPKLLASPDAARVAEGGAGLWSTTALSRVTVATPKTITLIETSTAAGVRSSSCCAGGREWRFGRGGSDVFDSFEYPPEWLLEGRYWTEGDVLRAFLSYNSAWDIFCR